MTYAGEPLNIIRKDGNLPSNWMNKTVFGNKPESYPCLLVVIFNKL